MHAHRADAQKCDAAARYAYIAFGTEKLVELFAPFAENVESLSSGVLTPVAL